MTFIDMPPEDFPSPDIAPAAPSTPAASETALPAADGPAPVSVAQAEPRYDGKHPVVSSDGKKHEFPPGTLMSVVDKAMKQYAEEYKDKSTFVGQMATGFMDPIEGGAQLVQNAMPSVLAKPINAANDALAEAGLTTKLPPGGMNQRVQDREKDIEKLRGNNPDIDWGRMTGNLLSPANYVGAIPAAGKLATMGVSALAGAAGGALAPATGENYWTEKAEQTGAGTVIGGALGLGGATISKGLEKTGEYLARNYPDVLNAKAVQAIVRRIHQDEKTTGISAADAIDLVNTAKKPLTLADVAGDNTLGLAGNVARQPGESRTIASQFLKTRDEAAAQRLSEDIATHLSGGPSMHQASEVLLQARSADGKPSYEVAHSLKNVWSPRLAQFLEDPAVRTGLAKGYEIERLVSLAEGRPITATQLGVDLGVDGATKLTGTPNMRLLDMAKQGLDAMIAEERNEITGRLSQRGVALDKMRRAYVDVIDNIDTTGAYKKARAQWAGYSQSLDAIRLGRTVFSASPEENAAAVTKLVAQSPGNIEFYRLGVADILKERLAKTGIGGDDAKALIRNPWMRDQLKPAFKSTADFDKFVDAVTAESQMFNTKTATLGGSQTAGRLAEDAGGEGSGLMLKGAKVLRDVAHANPLAAIRHAWQFYRDLGVKPHPELNTKISQILFSTKIAPETAEAMLSKEAPQLHIGPKMKSAADFSLFAPKMGGAQSGVGAGQTIDSLEPKKSPITGNHYVPDPNRPGKYLRLEQ